MERCLNKEDLGLKKQLKNKTYEKYIYMLWILTDGIIFCILNIYTFWELFWFAIVRVKDKNETV